LSRDEIAGFSSRAVVVPDIDATCSSVLPFLFLMFHRVPFAFVTPTLSCEISCGRLPESSFSLDVDVRGLTCHDDKLIVFVFILVSGLFYSLSGSVQSLAS
jgi:hypothetical protein